MKKLIFSTVLLISILTISAPSQTFLQKIAGNWEGTLEYLDYSKNQRVKLKTYLTVTPSGDGDSAEFFTVYDDFGRIIKKNETIRIDLPAKKYVSGKYEYAIDSLSDKKIVLRGSGQDGETIEPIRLSIDFDESSLSFLKETRTPWQFRNQTIFKRVSENILTKRTLPAAQLNEDFAVLKKALTAMHPGIYRYQTPESMEKLFDALEDKLKNPLPEGEFFKLLAQLTSQIYCGHTYLNPYNQNTMVGERLFGGKIDLPCYFQIIDGKMIVTENASAQNLAKGSEIRKINGIPAKKIIEALLSVTKADGRNTLAHRVQSIGLTRFEAERYALFDWYFPLFFPPPEDEIFTIEATDFATRKTQQFAIPAMSKAGRTAEMEKRYGKAPTYDDGWKFEIRDDRTAYLKIENSITWRLKEIKFKEFLADAFARLRAGNIKNLIIDLRGNDGGDTKLGFELARYLAKKNLPPYIASRRLIRNVAPQTDSAKFLDTYSEELKSDLQKGLPPNSYKKAENDFFEILPNENVTTYPPVTPDAGYFQGEAYIISDAGNASATFQFLNFVKENKLARIVGQETGGNR